MKRFLLLNVGLLNFVHCGYEIFGTIQRAHYEYDPMSIVATCFAGLSLESCRPQIDDDTLNFLPYFEEIIGIWCLQCCSSGFPSDEWIFDCPLTPSSAAANNRYGYSFRIARMRTLTDTYIHECPLNRSACPFNTDRSFDISRCGSDFSFLSGVTLNLDIVEHVFFSTNWIEVKDCEVVVTEANEIPSSITQIVNMRHTPTNYTTTPFHMVYLIGAVLLALMLGYKIIRRRECLSCGKIMVLYWQGQCLHCRIFKTRKPGLPMNMLMQSKEVFVYGIAGDPVIRSNKVAPIETIETVSEKVFLARVAGDKELTHMYSYLKSSKSAQLAREQE